MSTTRTPSSCMLSHACIFSVAALANDFFGVHIIISHPVEPCSNKVVSSSRCIAFVNDLVDPWIDLDEALSGGGTNGEVWSPWYLLIIHIHEFNYIHLNHRPNRGLFLALRRRISSSCHHRDGGLSTYVPVWLGCAGCIKEAPGAVSTSFLCDAAAAAQSSTQSINVNGGGIWGCRWCAAEWKMNNSYRDTVLLLCRACSLLLLHLQRHNHHKHDVGAGGTWWKKPVRLLQIPTRRQPSVGIKRERVRKCIGRVWQRVIENHNWCDLVEQNERLCVISRAWIMQEFF